MSGLTVSYSQMGKRFLASGFRQRLVILAPEIMSELTNILGQVDILRKTADGLVGFGEGRATFENEVIAGRRPIEGRQSPDDPCVLFQKMDWPPGLLSGDRKNISEILSRELQKLFSHGRPFLRCGQASRETGARDEFAERLGGKLPLDAQKCLFCLLRTKPRQRADCQAGRFVPQGELPARHVL